MGCAQTKDGKQNGKIFPEGDKPIEKKSDAAGVSEKILKEAAEAQLNDVQRIKKKRKPNLPLQVTILKGENVKE